MLLMMLMMMMVIACNSDKAVKMAKLEHYWRYVMVVVINCDLGYV